MMDDKVLKENDEIETVEDTSAVTANAPSDPAGYTEDDVVTLEWQEHKIGRAHV